MLDLYFKNVFQTNTIKDAISIYNDNKIDIILSDLKVSDGNGLDFIKEIRSDNLTIPIVILSAHKDEDFLFKAIPLNIFSYLLKPLSYHILLKLLNELSNSIYTPKFIDVTKSLKYSPKSKELYEDGKNITLTHKEILFIELLIKHPNAIVTNEMIQQDVWNGDIIGTGALKNLIFRLRKKINTEFLITVTSVGYKLSH